MQEQIHAQAIASALALSTQARNLQFLALIESTIDRVSTDTDHVRVCASSIVRCEEELKTHFQNAVIPDEDKLVELLDRIQDVARRMHVDAKRRHESACSDHMLNPDDGVVDVFEDMIAATQELFGVADEFKEWIETHNALMEPSTGQTFESVDDLMAALEAD